MTPADIAVISIAGACDLAAFAGAAVVAVTARRVLRAVTGGSRIEAAVKLIPPPPVPAPREAAAPSPAGMWSGVTKVPEASPDGGAP